MVPTERTGEDPSAPTPPSTRHPAHPVPDSVISAQIADQTDSSDSLPRSTQAAAPDSMPDVFKNFTAFLASRLALSSWDQALLTMTDIAVPDIAGTIINFWPGLWGFAKMEVDPNGDEVLMVGTGGAVGAASYDSRVYLCSPFVGSQIDFIRFRREFGIRLNREYLAGHEYSLEETRLGTDEYGVVSQANPATFKPLPGDPSYTTTALRKEAKDAYAQHKRRLATLASYTASLILDVNLKDMIVATHPRDGYAAWQALEAHCYREPNDLTVVSPRCV
mmetsp:Transcript_29274/g.93221  ORF Transcript_29274/g.93221 Transcript_29274/m.93221 type:complete len:277 (-) Transcript_29274:376-1206(-)